MTKQQPEEIKATILSLVEEYIESTNGEGLISPSSNDGAAAVSGRVYGSAEVKKLVESALEFWLTSGQFNQEFEGKLGTYLGRKHVLTVNSGSSANLVATAALMSPLLRKRRLNKGDEIITCATGFPTTVNPSLLYNLTPVFVDVDIPTYNIDINYLEDALTPRTRAIILAHTLGNPFNLKSVVEFADQHDLFLIEDTCDALGSTYHNKLVGSFGDIATLSFYPAHHITTGEGGAVFTDKSNIRRALESIRDWGRDCYCLPGEDNTCGKRFGWKLGDLPEGFDHKYTYSHIGFNLKMTDMQAAVGIEQLDRLGLFVEIRKRNFNLLYNALQRYQEFMIMPEPTPGSDPSWFGFPLTLKDTVPFDRKQIMQFLNSNDIGTRLLFGGNLVRQPYMLARHHRVVGNLESADKVMESTFWIGVYPGLSIKHIDYVIGMFDTFFRRYSKNID